MITGILALLFLIPVIVGAENGQWGTVAVFAVLIVLVLAFGVASREQDRAYNNFVDYWARGGPDGKRRTQRSRPEIAGRVTRREREEAKEKFRAYAEQRANGGKVPDAEGSAFVCHYCGRYVKAPCDVAFTAEGKVRLYRCPKCGKQNVTKI